MSWCWAAARPAAPGWGATPGPWRPEVEQDPSKDYFRAPFNGPPAWANGFARYSGAILKTGVSVPSDGNFMLHCTMNTSPAIQFALEDLMADLRHARRNNDLGRLALLAYCEVRGWARQAGKLDIAESAMTMFTENPCVSKAEFLEKIDRLIATLALHQQAYRPPGVQFSRVEEVSRQFLAS